MSAPPPPVPQQLQCNVCGQLKPLAAFVRDTTRRLGVRRTCKACHAAAAARRRRGGPGERGGPSALVPRSGSLVEQARVLAHAHRCWVAAIDEFHRRVAEEEARHREVMERLHREHREESGRYWVAMHKARQAVQALGDPTDLASQYLRPSGGEVDWPNGVPYPGPPVWYVKQVFGDSFNSEGNYKDANYKDGNYKDGQATQVASEAGSTSQAASGAGGEACSAGAGAGSTGGATVPTSSSRGT